MSTPTDEPRSEQYFREQILVGIGYGRGLNQIVIDIAEDDAGYSIEFKRCEASR